MVSDSPAQYKSLGIVKKSRESTHHRGAYSFILACSPDIGICKALHMILISNPNSKGLTQIYHLDSLYLKSHGDLGGVSCDLYMCPCVDKGAEQMFWLINPWTL